MIMDKIKIGITVGDINGVGLETVIKTLSNPKILSYCIPVIYGSSKVVSYHKNIVKPEEFQYMNLRTAHKLSPDRTNIVNCWIENVNITLGTATEDGGKYAHISLDRAVQDLKEGLIDVIVTSPVNKYAMQIVGFPYTGQTGYLSEKSSTSESLMLMVSDHLKVGMVTEHIPLSEVSPSLSRELIIVKLKVLNSSLKRDFGLEKPIIAVLGLNPHAGDNGIIGNQEEELIHPAVVEMKKKGILVSGPYASDGFFGSGEYRKFDAVLAMYHDQGLIPFKTLSFGEGVNYTAGLDFVRTAPDHGTGYKIAGKNEANPSSFRKALFMAMDIYQNRGTFDRWHSNPLKKKELNVEPETEVGSGDPFLEQERLS